ncbi:MAG: zinc-dependent metalloprotease, partial [Rikenellaceae bacterium]|nr:zinc-dependent metalloprotease [Rikenellaceae bacterium]
MLFEATELFLANREPALSPFPPAQADSSRVVSASVDSKLTEIAGMKAFADNASVTTWFSGKYTLNVKGERPVKDVPFSLTVTRSLLLLPEEAMKPRISDPRIGTFRTAKQHVSRELDGYRSYTLAHRWRLEPADREAYRRGEAVEPVDPVIFYIDEAFPAAWKEAVQEGVLRWNEAFRQIGFIRAVQVRDFPTDDPQFDPENLKYTCIRYIPDGQQNARGPSWVDPLTGRIVHASVLIHSDIGKRMDAMRFVQTAQVNPSVRSGRIPDRLSMESLAGVVAHEVGHCLGLTHNMGASSAFAVDSLRSPSFTQRYGITPSIMDYSRFNYIAQPEDRNLKLDPPRLGVYDRYANGWLYSRFPLELSVAEEK